VYEKYEVKNSFQVICRQKLRPISELFHLAKNTAQGMRRTHVSAVRTRSRDEEEKKKGPRINTTHGVTHMTVNAFRVDVNIIDPMMN
jgi:hypothetical protein